MNQKLALVSDFDGTISHKDFFDCVVEKLLNDNALDAWRKYLSGEKTHFDALKEIFSKIRISENDFYNFILNLGVDRKFFKVCDLCKKSGIPIYICSGGCDYYIRVMIGKEIDNYDIKLITNYSFYSSAMGLVMRRLPKTEKYYDYDVGVSKAAVVEDVKSQGYKVIYCGDGRPDFEAAKEADTVFARSVLLEFCKKDGVVTEKFDDFDDVYKFIEDNK